MKKIFVFLLALFFLFSGTFVVYAITLPLPDFDSFYNEQQKTLILKESTKVYDRNGVLLYDLSGKGRRTAVRPEEITDIVKKATIAIEDADFYTHSGVDLKSIARAFLANLSAGRVTQGGSTITQQVIKNIILSPDRTITRKVKEAILALRLEKTMTKDQIITLYLNEVPYGGNIYGIKEAAQAFFNKNISDLSITEAAYLAALPQAPSRYSPYGPNRKLLDERKNLVLKRMSDLGYIKPETYAKARKEKVVFAPYSGQSIKAPHFVFFVKSYLEDKYGVEALDRGMKVYTTLDYGLQQKAEQAVAKYSIENAVKFKAKNAAIVALDPKTAQILVLVGSANYFDNKNEGNFNVATAHRQPGSAFKPIVYATAFEKGYTPETVIFDLSTEFETGCTQAKCYKPVNYDGKYLGPITFRSALAQSRNVPAIKVLYLAGLQDSLNQAKRMGIKSLTNINQYGLTLVLGGGEVSLLDLTTAYSVFATEGLYRPYNFILKVEDNTGNVLEETIPTAGERVLSENSTRNISSILSDAEARAPVFGNNPLMGVAGRQVAVKTGTTNDYKDAWMMGYTPNLVVGAWVGNNDNSPMEKKVAGYIVTPMWNAFASQVLADLPDERFIPPNKTPLSLKPIFRGVWKGGESYWTDRISGQLATDYTPEETREEHITQSVHSILYWVDRANPYGPKPTNPNADPQFRLWEAPVRRWAAQNGYAAEGTITNKPTTVDNIHQPGSGPVFTITSPITDHPLKRSDQLVIKINSQSTIVEANYYLNGQFIGSNKNYPFDFTFSLNTVQNLSAANELKVTVYDTLRNHSEQTAIFVVNQ